MCMNKMKICKCTYRYVIKITLYAIKKLKDVFILGIINVIQL